MQKILFLEDDRRLAANYIRELKLDGFEVLHLIDATPAVTLVMNDTLDGLVVDLQLPVPTNVQPHEVGNGDQSGLWFLEKIRARMLQTRLPAFVLTNNLPKHREWLDAFEASDPRLPNYMLTRETKGNCGARHLPPRLRAQIAIVRSTGAGGG